jgi:hypothetical protein
MLVPILVGVAMAADLITFAIAIPIVGIHLEANPLMREAYVSYGLPMVMLIKAAATIAAILIIARVRRPRMRTLAVLICLAVPLLGATTNVVSVI